MDLRNKQKDEGAFQQQKSAESAVNALEQRTLLDVFSQP
jgi:hypothetical protein